MYNKKLFNLITCCLFALIVLCSCSSKSNDSSSESKKDTNVALTNDLSIVEHSLEIDSAGQLVLTVKVKNEMNKTVTYDYIGYRMLDEENTIVNDFDSWNTASCVTELEPGQMVEQKNVIYDENVAEIQIDTYCYEDEPENRIEKKFAQKYIIKLSEEMIEENKKNKEQQKELYENYKNNNESTNSKNSDKDQIIDEILDSNFSDFDSTYELFKNNNELMTDDEKRKCLKYLGTLKCINEFTSKIQSRLKNPHSFKLYSVESDGTAIELSENEFSLSLNIEYSGTNNLGGEVTETASAICSYTINIDTSEIIVESILSEKLF